MQHLAAGPELLGVRGQRTDPATGVSGLAHAKPALGQPGLRRDTRRRPAFVGAASGGG
ncbi:hypothetical protein [Nonomuraea sp. GTA35]|uniref:hypothetical protein n=1 Tax=Nonomuraea sp. GTA35 TaxID=1676746 RepID=UPI0035C1FBAC